MQQTSITTNASAATTAHKASYIAEMRGEEVHGEDSCCAECGHVLFTGDYGVLLTRPFEDFYCSRKCALEAAQEYLDRIADL